jgi:hypothetical protein
MKKIIIVLVAIIVIVLGYILIRGNTFGPYLPPTPGSARTITVSQASNENGLIQQLLASWKTTQSAFSVKAGESGTYNLPDKIQFISADTILVHYDDGLVDHISVLQFKNDIFTELKNIGVMSTMPLDQWQTLISTYGNVNYPFSNYQSSDYKTFVKVSRNIFVK